MAGGLAGCGHAFDADGQLAGSIADVAKCNSSYDSTAATPLPANFPTIDGTHPYQYLTQGVTRIWFTTAPGTSSKLVSIRDSILAKLRTDGYHETEEDQEPGAEADLGFSGPHKGTAQVRPLCSGRIRVRYVLYR